MALPPDLPENVLVLSTAVKELKNWKKRFSEF